jgi:hypothetical protein
MAVGESVSDPDFVTPILVLHHQGGSGGPHFCVQEPMLWLCVEFFDHLGHGQNNRHPLVHHQRLVDAHANEENNEFAIHVGC